MAIITRRVPDHIFVQFAYGAPHQTDPAGVPLPLGAFCGAQYGEKEYLVDDETGAIVGETAASGHAVPLNRDKIAELFGAQSVAMIDQIEAANAAAKAEHAAKLSAEKAAASLATANEAHTAAIAALEAQIAELTAPPATARTYMSDLWRRARDEESTVIEAIIASLSPKQRNLLNSVTYLDHADEQFPDIVAALTQAFGAERAAEMLAPSSQT